MKIDFKDINLSTTIIIVTALVSIIITDNYLIAIQLTGILLFIGLLIIANAIKESKSIIINNTTFKNKTGMDLIVEEEK